MCSVVATIGNARTTDADAVDDALTDVDVVVEVAVEVFDVLVVVFVATIVLLLLLIDDDDDDDETGEGFTGIRNGLDV